MFLKIKYLRTDYMPFTPAYPVAEDRRAYTLPAGRTGVLVLHGFMGSPISSRPLAEHLHQHGFTLHCPLLPGHGERPEKLKDVPRQAWIAEAEEGLAAIREGCDEIFILSHSMGAVLGAHLISKNPDIRGLVMIAPLWQVPSKAIYLTAVLRYVMPWLHPYRFSRLRGLTEERALDLYPDLDLDDPAVQAQMDEMTRVPLSGIDEMRKMARMGRTLWPQLRLPALVLQGQKDRAVKPGSAEALYAVLGSADKQLHLYPRAGHELMRPKDPAHTQVWAEVLEFLNDRGPQTGDRRVQTADGGQQTAVMAAEHGP